LSGWFFHYCWLRHVGTDPEKTPELFAYGLTLAFARRVRLRLRGDAMIMRGFMTDV